MPCGYRVAVVSFGLITLLPAGFVAFDGLIFTEVSMNARYRFTSREFDSETGIFNYRARWYDPTRE
jgi:hypothetical protein